MASVLLALAAASVSRSALASRPFPGELHAAVPMPCEPTCDVCHLDSLGGPGKIAPGGFADGLREYGLVREQPGTVAPAIEGARAAQMNTDDDEMPDVDELAIGRNPNSSDPKVYICDAGPEYGCGSGSRIAPGRAFDAVALLAAAATLAVGALRARRRAL
jgi:hypothetical protein